jgi:hypothetical protein
MLRVVELLMPNMPVALRRSLSGSDIEVAADADEATKHAAMKARYKWVVITALALGFIVLGAVIGMLDNHDKGWGWLTGVYFSMVTLTTVIYV